MAAPAASARVTAEPGRNGGKRDPRLIPSCVIYDAELSLHPPLDLWLSTGIRALDHAVETILDDGGQTYSDTLCLEAIRRLFSSLPAAKARPGSLDVRTENQVGAWLSYSYPPAASGLKGP